MARSSGCVNLSAGQGQVQGQVQGRKGGLAQRT